MYSLTGELKRYLYEGLHNPLKMHYLPSRNELIVAEYVSEVSYESRIVIVDLYDHSVSEIKNEKLHGHLGFCVIEEDQLCIVGRISNNIVLMSKDGKVHQELLTKDRGLIHPQAVCFDENRKLLIVTFTNNKFTVFRLEI